MEAYPSPREKRETASSPSPPTELKPNQSHAQAQTQNPNPYPTTFVQADTSSFKQVVQMLTGSPQTAASAAAKPSTSSAAASSGGCGGGGAKSPFPGGPKKPPFKQQLYERRSNAAKNLRIISPLITGQGFFHPGPGSTGPGPNSPVLSPSMLDFPSLVLSPVTPLVADPFNRPPAGTEAAATAEERAIAKKGFYLHPSPRGSSGIEAPRLLPLFPLTSPKARSASPIN